MGELRASGAARDGRTQPPAFGLWLDGRSRPAGSGAVFERRDPFDGSTAATFANGDDSDALAAIAIARAAFDAGPWPRSSARTRFQVLMRVARILSDNAKAMAERMVFESGKPMQVALG